MFDPPDTSTLPDPTVDAAPPANTAAAATAIAATALGNSELIELRRDAQALARQRDQLEDLLALRTHELALATRRAEAGDVAKTAFLANMSHEIRTPLSAITGMVHLLRRSPVTPQQARWLGQLETASLHLLDIVSAILDLSRIEAGKLTLDDAEVDPARIVANVAALVAQPAAAKQLALVVETGRLPPGLLGDAARLQQALLNYAANAVKFTDTGQVTLRVRRGALPAHTAAAAANGTSSSVVNSATSSAADDTADYAPDSLGKHTTEGVLIHFEVQDSGSGIAPETVPRLFKAFEQVDNSSTRRHGGTGLGLALVRQLARLMGGEAGVYSTPGLGSTFWFTARLQQGGPPALNPGVRISSAEAQLVRDHADARLLLVDDEAMVRIVTRELLRCVFSHVDVAHDGRQALRLAGLHAYDLILMDVQMPTMDGLEATRQIRTLPGGRLLPIVGLSANAAAENRTACLSAGMDGFLAKPFGADRLFDTVLQALSGSQRGRAAAPAPAAAAAAATAAPAAAAAAAGSTAAQRSSTAGG